MKSPSDNVWVKSNGKLLEVREVSDPIYFLESYGPGFGPPLPIVNEVMSKDKARRLVAGLDKTNYKIGQ